VLKKELIGNRKVNGDVTRIVGIVALCYIISFVVSTFQLGNACY